MAHVFAHVNHERSRNNVPEISTASYEQVTSTQECFNQLQQRFLPRTLKYVNFAPIYVEADYDIH